MWIGSAHRASDPSVPMIAGDWTDLLALVLLGAVLVLVGLIVGWVVQAARARRTRNSR